MYTLLKIKMLIVCYSVLAPILGITLAIKAFPIITLYMFDGDAIAGLIAGAMLAVFITSMICAFCESILNVMVENRGSN